MKYIFRTQSFNSMPNKIFCYWISSKVVSHFEKDKKIIDFGAAKQGLSTSDNNKFLRFWHELKLKDIYFLASSTTDAAKSGFKWFPYNKAGTFKRWASIDEYVCNYKDDGKDIKELVMKKYPYLNSPDFVVKNTDCYFKKGISWNDVSTGSFSCRYIKEGYIFADVAPTFFSSDDMYFLGYFNCKVFQLFADIICQGLHYSTGHIPEIPCLYNEQNRARVRALAEENVRLSELDRDSFEKSWMFKKHPLV